MRTVVAFPAMSLMPSQVLSQLVQAVRQNRESHKCFIVNYLDVAKGLDVSGFTTYLGGYNSLPGTDSTANGRGGGDRNC